MTQKEKNIAIAKSDGWTIWDDSDMGWYRKEESKHLSELAWVCNYFKDLNACHELFHSMRIGDQVGWLIKLEKIVKARVKALCASDIDDESVMTVCINALAEERAEAYGLQIKLWKEGE